jgi:hypothetical protein
MTRLAMALDPAGLAFDSGGNLYVACNSPATGNGLVEKFDTSGNWSFFAGSGFRRQSPDWPQGEQCGLCGTPLFNSRFFQKPFDLGERKQRSPQCAAWSQ